MTGLPDSYLSTHPRQITASWAGVGVHMYVPITLMQVEEASRLRTKTQQAAAWLEARHLPAIRGRIDMQRTLESITRDIRSAHTQLSAGSLSTFGAHLELYHTPWVPTTFYYSNGEEHFHQVS